VLLLLQHVAINQSINQSKHISIAPYVASESEAHNVNVLLSNSTFLIFAVLVV